MLPSNWRPIETQDLVRVGPTADGGYVVTQRVLDNTDVLFGLGVSNNWAFEEDFKARSNCFVICYDHTIDIEFWAMRTVREIMVLLSGKGNVKRQLKRMMGYWHYRRFFDKKKAVHHLVAVGYDVPGAVSIDTMVRDYPGKKLFFKVDIEGWEYRVLDQLPKHRDVVSGFVIEFHDIDLQRDRISSFINSLADYRLVHVHPNNFGGIDPQGDPLVVEMTFIRTDLLDTSANRTWTGSDRLDFPNDPRIAELQLTFA